MHGAGKEFRSLQLAFDECLVDDHLRGDVGEFSLQVSTCFRMGSKFLCIRSTPTEMQSIKENDFECLASTGVNAPGTMFPNFGCREVQPPPRRLPGPESESIACSVGSESPDYLLGTTLALQNIDGHPVLRIMEPSHHH
jgi:hypothetical protein